jgi:hypothetical protein
LAEGFLGSILAGI